MEKLVIVGTGSQAGYVIDIVQHGGSFEVVGLVDIERASNVGKIINGARVICLLNDIDKHIRPSEARIVVAYGKNDIKREIVESLASRGFEFSRLISAAAYVSQAAQIGEGCIVNPLAAIMPGARLGRHVIIHTQAAIEHDNVLEDYVNVGPGVSLGGGVQVGQGSYVYTGASVSPRITIGKWAVIGAGAVVIHNVSDYDVVAGVPAKSIKGRA